MRQQNALGPPGRARGVDLHGDVVVVHIGDRGEGIGGDKGVPFGCADDDVGHVGWYERCVLGIGDDQSHVGVVEDVCLRLRGKPGVERHEDQPRSGRPEHHVVVLATVGGEQADAGERRQATGSEARPAAQGSFSQRRRGDPLGRCS